MPLLGYATAAASTAGSYAFAAGACPSPFSTFFWPSLKPRNALFGHELIVNGNFTPISFELRVPA